MVGFKLYSDEFKKVWISKIRLYHQIGNKKRIGNKKNEVDRRKFRYPNFLESIGIKIETNQ